MIKGLRGLSPPKPPSVNFAYGPRYDLGAAPSGPCSMKPVLRLGLHSHYARPSLHWSETF